MGDKVTVANITNITTSSGTEVANENFDKVADEFDKVLYRDGSQSVTGDIDMDSNRILNLPMPISNAEPIRYDQISDVIADAVAEAVAAVDEAMQDYVDETAANAALTALDRIATAADRVQTGLDRVATLAASQDAINAAVGVHADALQVAADRIATAADRVQTGLDRAATAADRVQTNLDRIATAADRVQTGLDRIAAALSRTGAETARTTANLAAVSAAASQLSVQQMIAAISLPTAFYATHAAAVADIANIAPNATVSVIADEDQSGYYTLYKKISGVLTYQGSVLPPLFFLRSDMSRAANRNKVIAHNGTSRTQGLPNTRLAYESILFSSGAPYEGVTSYNMGGNGATLSGVVALIASGDQAEPAYDYLPVNTVPPAPHASGTSNPWATVNADPDEIWSEFGTNDFRIGWVAGTTIANFRRDLNRYTLFMLLRTRAKISFAIPAPIGFANPDPQGFTDCVTADDAANRSAEMRQCYLEIAALPSNRIEVIDTHKLLYGFRYDTIFAALDPEGSGLPLAADTLHNTAIGDMRLYQIRARIMDRSLPQTATHLTVPLAILQNAPWKRVVRVRGGGTNVINIDNNEQRVAGDIAKAIGAVEPSEGQVSALSLHTKATDRAYSAPLDTITSLRGLRQAYFWFPKTGITIGPVDVNDGVDSPLNGYRAFGATGDFSNTTTGYATLEIGVGRTITNAIVYVMDKRFVPTSVEAQTQIPIVMQGVQPLQPLLATATTTTSKQRILITALTSGRVYPGLILGGTGISANSYIIGAGTSNVVANINGTTTLTVTACDGWIGVGTLISGNGIPNGTYITSGVTTGGAGGYVMSEAATTTATGVAMVGTPRGGVGPYDLSATMTATATGIAVTNYPVGYGKQARSSGSITMRGAKGSRSSSSGTAAVEVYVQGAAAGGFGAIPYPGALMGTLTFTSSNYSASFANWAQNTTLWPLLTTTVTITGGGGSGAVPGAVTIVGGAITAIAVGNGGTGYTSPPTVTITNGGGTGATATANLTGTVITSYTVNTGGSGYLTTAYPNGPNFSISDDTMFYARCISGTLGNASHIALFASGV